MQRASTSSGSSAYNSAHNSAHASLDSRGTSAHGISQFNASRPSAAGQPLGEAVEDQTRAESEVQLSQLHGVQGSPAVAQHMGKATCASSAAPGLLLTDAWSMAAQGRAVGEGVECDNNAFEELHHHPPVVMEGWAFSGFSVPSSVPSMSCAHALGPLGGLMKGGADGFASRAASDAHTWDTRAVANQQQSRGNSSSQRSSLWGCKCLTYIHMSATPCNSHHMLGSCLHGVHVAGRPWHASLLLSSGSCVALCALPTGHDVTAHAA